MNLDPIASVVTFLRSLPDLPPGSVTGDLSAREVGDTTIYVEHDGGYRVERDAELDRVYIAYEVYSLDREEAASLAFLVRKLLLRGLRNGVTVKDLFFLDSRDEELPDYEPDGSSREHVYCGVVSLYYLET
jgi:hypothetical protein